MPRKPKKYHYIYKTTNKLNNKFYIGMHSTDDLNDGYLGSGKYLQRAVKKYGRKNFKIEFLEFLNTREELIEKEEYVVNKDLLQNPLCMNLRTGGNYYQIKELHHSEEHRLKMSAYRKNKTYTDIVGEKRAKDWKNKLSDSLKPIDSRGVAIPVEIS